MRSIILVLLLALTMFAGRMPAQDVIIKSPNGETKVNTKRLPAKTIAPANVIPGSIARRNAGPVTGDNSMSWKLNQSFESGTFPPAGWTIGSGNLQWNLAAVSGYGNGSYSANYDLLSCYIYNTELTSPVFTPTSAGDALVFNVAYAPYGDSLLPSNDGLTIYYFNDSTLSFEFLITLDSDSLQTAPASYTTFVPDTSQWRTVVLELPANASQIMFQPNEDCGNSLYLDDIRVGTQPAPTVLFQDFEATFPPAGWDVQPDWGYASISAYGSGTGSVLYDLYQCNGTPTGPLTTSQFLPTTGGELSFDYAYAAYSNIIYDDLEIYVSSNGGMTFDLLYIMSGNPLGGELPTSPPTLSYFTPNSSEWGSKTIAVPDGTQKIRFVLTNGCSNSIYLDNIAVSSMGGGGGTYDAQVLAVWNYSKAPLTFGAHSNISAAIKNNSGTSIQNLMVYYSLTGANNYSDSVMVSSIPAGEIVNVPLPGFAPVLNGISDVTVSIPDDNNNSNNSKTGYVLVNNDTYRYADTACCNSGVAYFQTGSFLNRYEISGTAKIAQVRMGIYPDNNNVGQTYYGVVLDQFANLVARSKEYKLKASDHNGLVTFDISDPKPHSLSNGVFYAGVVQTMGIGESVSFAMNLNSENTLPPRPQSNYYGADGPLGSYFSPGEATSNFTDFELEAVVKPVNSTDAGVAGLGDEYLQYYSSNTFTPSGKVFNAGTSAATFSVRRTITGGGPAYTSTKTVSNLAPNSSAWVTFDPWTFSSSPGFTYNVRDSIIMTGDMDPQNNVMRGEITPRIAKQLCVLYQSARDRDSLVRAIIADGRYSANFDTVGMNYTGSLRPWKIVYGLFRDVGNYNFSLRDTMKAFLDASTSLNKKSLMLFADNIPYYNDPQYFWGDVQDTIFLRQYLKAMAIGYDWTAIVPSAANKFRGAGSFGSITQDSLYVDQSYVPNYIRAVNGGTAAFKPRTVISNDNDSCNAVCFAGPNFNTFLMTNRFSNLRYSATSTGPLNLFARTLDWIANPNPTVKTLTLKAFIEGFYNASANTMVSDTVRVYLRNTSAPFAVIDSAKAVLGSNGTGSFSFFNALNGVPYYIHAGHRNGLETWSASGQSFVSGALNYDFTTSFTQAFGANMIQIDNSPVAFGFYSGDVNRDGSIDVTDLGLIDNDAFNFLSGYLPSDVTGDDNVDISDLTVTDNNVFNFVGKIVP